MSVRVLSAVWDNSLSAGSDRLVLLALADYANDQWQCWPKQSTIAEKCRVSMSTVYRCLMALREVGELHVLDRREHGLSSIYTICQNDLGSGGACVICEGRGQSRVTGGSVTVDRTEPLLEPSLNRAAISDIQEILKEGQPTHD